MNRRFIFSRRGLVGATAFLTAGVLLAGCSGGQQSTAETSADAPVTLEMWSGGSDQVVALAKKLAAEFHEAHPNVTINVSRGASKTAELLQKITAGFAGDAYPDISFAFGSWAGELEASGRTLDITDQVADPAVKWDELPAAARQTVQPTGTKTIGFPAIVDNLALVYNKKLFDDAGVAHPTNDWTWDDFRTAAKELTDASTQTYGYAYAVSGSEETVWQFWPHLWQRGGEILNDDGTKAAFASDAGVQALNFLKDMTVTDQSVYLDQADDKTSPLFNAGRIAMITAGPWQLSDTKEAGIDYGVTILPGTDGNHQTVSGPDIWALFDHNDANRAHWAFEFTNWLTSPAQNEVWASETSNLPLRSSSVSSEAFQKQAADLPGFELFAQNLENATTARPTVPGYVGLSTAVGKAISTVLQGKADAGEALQKAAAEADEALSE